MQQLTWIAQILKTNLATLNVLRNVLMHSITMRQNQTAKNTVPTLTIATSHHLVQKHVLMLQRMNNVQENARSMKEIRNVAMDAQENVAVLLAKGDLWKNAGNITWSLMNVSMRSALASAWRRLRKGNAHQNVRNMQEIRNAAVSVLLNVRRNPYGENAQLNARSMQAILTVVRQPVQLNVPTSEEKSAVLGEFQNVMGYPVAALKNLMWCLGMVFTWRMRTSDQ